MLFRLSSMLPALVHSYFCVKSCSTQTSSFSLYPDFCGWLKMVWWLSPIFLAMSQEATCRSSSTYSMNWPVFVVTGPPPADLSMVSFSPASNRETHPFPFGGDRALLLKTTIISRNVFLGDLPSTMEKLKIARISAAVNSTFTCQ